MRFRNFFAALLAVCVLLATVPVQPTYAESETVFVVGQEWESELIQREEHDGGLTSGPVLAEGNHLRWIDRIGNLPDFAVEFYGWLEDNATVGGALVDPSLGVSYNNGRAYKVATVTGSVEFTYAAGDSLSSLAFTAAQKDLGNISSYISSYIFAAYGAFDRDHPEVFWLSGASKCGSGLSYSYKRNTGSTATSNYTMDVYFYLSNSSFDLRAEDYRDTEVIAEAIAERDANVERILDGVPDDATAYEQVLYFNDVLTAENAYNSAVWYGDLAGAADTAWECISALSGSVGVEGPVCEGYARAFKVLCDQVGIPCVLVEGYSSSGDHMWNNVQLDGNWYGVDVTWNDPVEISTLEQQVSGYESRTWIGLGANTMTNQGVPFKESHLVENIVSTSGLNYLNGPVLSENAYEPPVAMDIESYRSAEGYTAPQKEGYVFAGWYLDSELTQPLPKDQTAGFAYPKFLQEETLSVKFQTTYGTTAESASTDLRLLTSVADLELSKVSFRVSIGAATQTISSQTVYKQVKSGGTLISGASEIFSEDSAYFVTYVLLGVPQGGFETTWTVLPCWETLDGTVVEGISRTFSISETY